MVQSVREGKCKVAEFSYGNLTKEYNLKTVDEPNGTTIVFRPDDKIFTKFRFIHEFIESRIWHYAYLNAGLRIHYLNKTYVSKNGLKDMLERRTDGETIHYPLIHLKGEDIEVVITHGLQYGEQYYSFVNGQYTSQGGTHLNYFRKLLSKQCANFIKRF